MSMVIMQLLKYFCPNNKIKYVQKLLTQYYVKLNKYIRIKWVLYTKSRLLSDKIGTTFALNVNRPQKRTVNRNIL